MDDNDIEYAVRLYRKNAKDQSFTLKEFAQEIVAHKERRPQPYNSIDPLSFYNNIQRLWNCLEISMKDLVSKSGMDMAKFSRRFCIPYRTLQSWCDGTNPCPVYTKLMILEILNSKLNMFPRRTIYSGEWYHAITGEKL